MSPSPKQLSLTWEEVHNTGRALAWKLLDKTPKDDWKGVIAITRGGLFPAGIIARELELKLIDTFCISSYDHQSQRKANILKFAAQAGDGAGWIVIDDLVDSGNTYRIAREHLPNAHYACLYAKPQGAPTCDTFITEFSQDTWLHFPWDLKEGEYSQPIKATRTPIAP